MAFVPVHATRYHGGQRGYSEGKVLSQIENPGTQTVRRSSCCHPSLFSICDFRGLVYPHLIPRYPSVPPLRISNAQLIFLSVLPPIQPPDGSLPGTIPPPLSARSLRSLFVNRKSPYSASSKPVSPPTRLRAGGSRRSNPGSPRRSPAARSPLLRAVVHPRSMASTSSLLIGEESPGSSVAVAPHPAHPSSSSSECRSSLVSGR
ncbi:hypothetical protein FA13DRAFT_1031911 [Coprinellus micaceus]|uniref:Uncharacterized protein n=1 Tax=Coprinellus micaceus TaxID=71717 RepID=A0A4Y7RNU5_COPMI|nr:hypothetical protein FA13DRAFT_1031911 [Coprinellus micaceus]